MKRYRILGKEKTIEDWCKEYPFMLGRDFANPKYGFEEVKEQPERIEVTVYGSEFPGAVIQFRTNKAELITKDKFPLIKKAIEQVLNDDRPCAFNEKKLQERYEEMLRNPPIYTQQQLNEIEEKAFNAARSGLGDSEKHAKQLLKRAKYTNYLDYASNLGYTRGIDQYIKDIHSSPIVDTYGDKSWIDIQGEMGRYEPPSK